MKRREISNSSTVWLLIILFIVSLVFRLWLNNLSPQPFVYDQGEYEFYAQKIYSNPWLLASHTYRSYLYPLFLATVYRLSSFGNHELVIYLQAALDSFVSICIYIVLAHGLKAGKWSWVGGVLYALNPFTSGYVGVLLTEVLTTFFMGATLATGVMYFRTRNAKWAFLFGLSAGCTGQARNQVLALSLVPLIAAMMLLSLREQKKQIVAILGGFIVTMAYPVYVNWRDYKEITFTTVDNMIIRELYNGAVVGKLRAFRDQFPVESQIMWKEFYSEINPGRTSAERKELNKKYLGLTRNIIWKDPVGYLNMRFEKMWFAWQKESIYVFSEPGFESHAIYTYIGNLVFLTLGAFGFYVWWGNTKDVTNLWLRRAMVGTICVATVGFSLVNAEQRYTIPLYPMVCIGATLGIAKLTVVLRERLVVFRKTIT